MVQEGLVSVIMPTHNGGKFMKDSIQSVLSQTYANLELLIPQLLLLAVPADARVHAGGYFIGADEH